MGGSSFLKDISFQNLEYLRQYMTDEQILNKLWEVSDPLLFNEALLEIQNLSKYDN